MELSLFDLAENNEVENLLETLTEVKKDYSVLIGKVYYKAIQEEFQNFKKSFEDQKELIKKVQELNSNYNFLYVSNDYNISKFLRVVAYIDSNKSQFLNLELFGIKIYENKYNEDKNLFEKIDNLTENEFFEIITKNIKVDVTKDEQEKEIKIFVNKYIFSRTVWGTKEKTKNYSLINKKIKFNTSLVHNDKIWSIHIDEEKKSNLFYNLRLFDNSVVCPESFENRCYYDKEKEVLFDFHYLGGTKIEKLKFFKNSTMEIHFTSCKYANEFYNFYDKFNTDK
jgi:hypothetical protein